MDKKLIEIRKKAWDIFDNGRMTEEEYSFIWDRIKAIRTQIKFLNIPHVTQRSEQLLDFVRWQNRQSTFVKIPESMVAEYETYLEYVGGKSK